MLITETNSTLSINDAINKVQGKMTDVWTCTGYEDFLKDDSDRKKEYPGTITASLNNIVAAFSVKYIVCRIKLLIAVLQTFIVQKLRKYYRDNCKIPANRRTTETY